MVQILKEVSVSQECIRGGLAVSYIPTRQIYEESFFVHHFPETNLSLRTQAAQFKIMQGQTNKYVKEFSLSTMQSNQKLRIKRWR